ncbi:MAG: alpha-amylase family glycosyl hydrolase [Acidimicrobiales bacterium]
MNPHAPSDRWWHDAIGYSLYLRSFADGDGDGVGDLPGLCGRLEHLVALGIDLLWVTPFHPSPMVDFGYDVTDHLAVDPRYGTLGDVATLLERAHALGLRVVIDLVANHTSVQHPWFLAAAAEPSGPYRPYYLWGDADSDGAAPNNWVSYFGGPAWTAHPERGDHHLHLFLSEQADLNWRHPAVIDEFDRIVAHWLDLGVDGFRIDAAQTFVKDAALRPNPQRAPFDPAADRRTQWDAFEHRHDISQPETAAIFRRWQRACRRRGAVLLGETHIEEVDGWASLVRRGGLDVAFWFGLIDLPWRADAVQAALRAPLDALADTDTAIGWVTSTLDDVRAPTRLGGGDTGRRRALALLTLVCALPGVPVLYQGEELGLTQGVLGDTAPADRIGARGEDSRDGCRTPMPWEPGPSFGFSPSGRSWLPDGGRTDADTAAAQVGVPGSWFERHRALLALRRTEPPLRERRPPVWFDRTGEGVVALRRGPLLVVANLGPEPVPVGMAGVACFDSDSDSDNDGDGSGLRRRRRPLAPDRALIVRLDDPPTAEAP